MFRHQDAIFRVFIKKSMVSPKRPLDGSRPHFHHKNYKFQITKILYYMLLSKSPYCCNNKTVQ